MCHRYFHTLIVLAALCSGAARLLAMSEQPGAASASPAWMKGAIHLLPPVSTEALVAIRRAGFDLWGDDTDDFNPPPQQLEAARTVLRLGDEAAKALIWIYAEAYPNPELGRSSIGWLKHRILGMLEDDLEAAKWIVPLLRLRIEWAREQLSLGTAD